MIPIVVTTSNKYLYALKAFAHLFNKYWDKEQMVQVVCFDFPDFDLPHNFLYYSMGDQVNYPVNKWSNAILEFLEMHPEMDHFVLMFEDYWLSRQVDVTAVKMLYDYARQFENVIKVDLCGDRLYAGGMTDYNVCGRLDLIKSDPGSQYHMSLMAGIWSRELFMRYVQRDESPWDVELNGTPRLAAAGDNVLVIGTRQWPVRHILALRGGDADKLLPGGLQKADLDELTSLGLLER